MSPPENTHNKRNPRTSRVGLESEQIKEALKLRRRDPLRIEAISEGRDLGNRAPRY